MSSGFIIADNGKCRFSAKRIVLWCLRLLDRTQLPVARFFTMLCMYLQKAVEFQEQVQVCYFF